VNPLLEDWTAPFGAPPLDRIRPEHFIPAYTQALSDHDAEIAGIAGDPAPADFSNTIVALERSGKLLTRIDAVFSAFSGSATNDALQAIEMEMAPRLSAHWTAIYLNAALFARLDAVWRRRDEFGLDPESLKVLERIHLDFVRAGARLSPEARARMDAAKSGASEPFASSALVPDSQRARTSSPKRVDVASSSWKSDALPNTSRSPAYGCVSTAHFSPTDANDRHFPAIRASARSWNRAAASSRSFAA